MVKSRDQGSRLAYDHASMIEVTQIMAVLQTIPDPEMPINILDLGLVKDVRIESSHSLEGGARGG